MRARPIAKTRHAAKDAGLGCLWGIAPRGNRIWRDLAFQHLPPDRSGWRDPTIKPRRQECRSGQFVPTKGHPVR